MLLSNYHAIKPVETMYEGVLYRSRLEAQWAYIFDIFDYEHMYEPYCFDRWLADFSVSHAKLRERGVFEVLVEVKPFKFEILNGVIMNMPDVLVAYRKAVEQDGLGVRWLLGNGFIKDRSPKSTSQYYWGAKVLPNARTVEFRAMPAHGAGDYSAWWKKSINKTRLNPKKSNKKAPVPISDIPLKTGETAEDRAELLAALEYLKQQYVERKREHDADNANKIINHQKNRGEKR